MRFLLWGDNKFAIFPVVRKWELTNDFFLLYNGAHERQRTASDSLRQPLSYKRIGCFRCTENKKKKSMRKSPIPM